MPSRKKKYNARFPAGRIKKIMQSDEEIGKVAKAVPVIISKTLELFVETLLAKTVKITNSRNAKTLSPSHMKQCIMSEKNFDFLRDLVKNIPDISVAEEAANYQEEDAAQSSPDDYPDSDTPYDLSMPSTSAAKRILSRSETMPNGSTISSSRNSGMVELQRSLSQNGYVSSNRTAGHLKRETQNVQRLQQTKDLTALQNINAAPSSVIKHTTSIAAVNSDYLPNKLLRSDTATTTTTTSNMDIQRSPNSTESTSKGAVTSPTTSTQANKIQNAIPAPIVSFDFCNKPVVKIDYSNLPLTSTSTSNAEMTTVQPIAPLSAPAQLNDTSIMNPKLQTAYDFNATAAVAPVINIDLSNIVPPIMLSNAAAAGAGAAANAPSAGTQPAPAIATITIGNLPATKVNSKVNDIIATSINTAVAAAAAGVPATAHAPALTTVNSSNSLDLDEDYDNI